MSVFAALPAQAALDARLTHRQLRVLIALYSFRRREDDLVWPSRQAIADRCGLRPDDVSAATSRLQALGWLAKDGQGGHGKACRYRLTVPEGLETPPGCSGVPDTTTPPGCSSRTPPECSSRTPPHPGGGIEQRREHRKEQRKEKNKEKGRTAFDPGLVNPLPERVPRDAWLAFVAYRRERRKPISERSATMLLRRLATFADPVASLEASIANGWTGVFDQRNHHGKKTTQARRGPLERIRDAYAREAGLEPVDTDG